MKKIIFLSLILVFVLLVAFKYPEESKVEPFLSEGINFYLIDQDGKEIVEENIIDAKMIQIKVKTKDPSKTTYLYKYLEKNITPTDDDWNTLNWQPFYENMYFYQKESPQWIIIHIKDSKGNEFKKAFSIKGDILKNPPDGPVDPWEYTNSLGAGFDVTWSQFGNGIRNFKEEHVVDIKKAGFSHVRIRTDKDATEEDLFNHLDKSIEYSLRHGIYPIIARGVKETKEKEATDRLKEYYVDWWKTIANRYKNYSHKLSFNLFIEISGKSQLSDWDILNDWYKDITKEIRNNTKGHNIIYASTNVSDPSELKNLIVPDSVGEYYFAEWHKWASGPAKRNGKKLWTTGTKKEKEDIIKEIDFAKKWSKRTGKPTWVGAWMPGYYNYNNNVYISQQVEFSNFLVKELREAGIPYAVNAFPSHYYNIETNQWKEEFLPVIEAINQKTIINQDDIDGDGLTNDEEINIYNTNPRDVDTDNDHIVDNMEIVYGLNPLDKNDGDNRDTDGDGMNNAIEIHYGLNPLDSKDKEEDPDQDGIVNLWEIKMISNPFNKDSRGIGLNDGEADFDKDGLTNIEEIEEFFTDPIKKDNIIKKNK